MTQTSHPTFADDSEDDASSAAEFASPPDHGALRGMPDATPSAQGGGRQRKAVLGVPIEVIVSVGKARPYLTDLVALRRDSVIPLDTNIADPVEIIIGGRVIARGELQEIEAGTGRLGVRLTEITDLTQSL